ncbi:mRNA decay protein [Vanrija albida]|uniref:mRNA decay protein n=1 Tax=Vanrija albida TaxID=181172 RepID=A0ABR3PYJ3_9TREE
MSTADYVSKYARRRAQLSTVEKYWLDEANRPPGQLDSSLKKHTTLLNRLKAALLVGPADTLIKEIDGLVLTKYLEEIVAAVVEGASRGRGDPDVAVDVIVHLHTRLAPEFFPLLLPPLLAILAPPPPPAKDASEKDREKDDKERITRQRPVLRIVAELALLGAWPEGALKGGTEVGKVLKTLMSNDPQYSNMPLLATFLKSYNRAYLGPQPPADGAAVETLPNGVEELMPPEVQKSMRALFTTYFQTASKTLVKGQMKLLEQDKRNHDAYIKSGEIFEDRQNAYERMTRAVERLTIGVQGLADLLGLSPPVLPTAASLAKSGLQIVNSTSSFTVRDDGAGNGIWDDDEERRFYEQIPDLIDLVPPALLGIKDKSAAAKESTKPEGEEDQAVEAETADADAEAQKRDEEDIRRQLAQLELEPGEAEKEPSSVNMDRNASAISDTSGTHSNPLVDDEPVVDPLADGGAAGEEDGLSSGPAARLAALFAALPEAVNREMVDKLAIEFAFLNSKAARRRLVKFIGSVPKNRTDLLPHYSRFIAILDKYMPDVGSGVLDILDEELRYLQRKRAIRELDSVRLKNVRFYGELAKFKVARPYTILHVLKVFLDDFKFNVENIANLLETCGRFLLRNEGTAETAKSMVELMRRKQSHSHLDQRHVIMLENAFYQCNPPERVAREIVELPPMQAFIQHLLYEVLMKRTQDKVFKLLRKLHWEDEETFEFILRSFTDVWELKYENIGLLAGLVYDLQRYHPDFAVAVVDQVMEDVRIGMEDNIFKFNQRRIASIKFLGELYMYRVVNSSVVFDVLWSLLSFGHPEGLPVPGRDSPIDSVSDFFRVRLACAILDTCGICFAKGSLRRKLDQYLVVLQLYALCKTDMPPDVEFMLDDIFEALRPKGRPKGVKDGNQVWRLRTFEEAAFVVDEILATNVPGGNDSDDDDESEDGDGRIARIDDDDAEIAAAQNARLDDDDEEDSDDDDDEDVVVLREPKRDEFDEQAEAAFDRDFARMIADTTVERKAAPPVFDQAVPMFRKRQPGGPAHGRAPASDDNMQFMLLSKKGNKPQVRSVDIPVDSTFASNVRTHQLASKAEQEQLKRLVLQNEQRQENEGLMAVQQSMRNRGINVRVLNSG